MSVSVNNKHLGLRSAVHQIQNSVKGGMSAALVGCSYDHSGCNIPQRISNTEHIVSFPQIISQFKIIK